MTLDEVYAVYLADPSEENKQLFGKVLFNFCNAYVKKHYCKKDSAYRQLKDAVTETCLRVWQDLAKYDATKVGKESQKGRTFTSWVRMILDSDVIDIMRAYKKEDVPLYDNHGASSSQFDRLDAKITVRQLMSTLAFVDQKFIKMKLDGYEDIEIAAEFGQTLYWVDNHFRKLKEDMRAAGE